LCVVSMSVGVCHFFTHSLDFLAHTTHKHTHTQTHTGVAGPDGRLWRKALKSQEGVIVKSVFSRLRMDPMQVTDWYARVCVCEQVFVFVHVHVHVCVCVFVGVLCATMNLRVMRHFMALHSLTQV
jgi:hypothetical protein